MMTRQLDKEYITQKYFSLINLNNIELFKLMKENHEKIESIYPLIEFILKRLETVTKLTIDNRIWDAEIILRSAVETFVKFVFITSAGKAEQKIRIDEYWNQLAEINSIKQSEQAKKNLEFLGDSEIHRIAFSPMILSDEVERTLRAKWTKKKKKKLEQKWSFSQLIYSLSQDYKGKPFDIFITLSHGYRMSSHVTHGDETGILIIRERNSRIEEDKETAYFAHYLRLLSDCLTYVTFIAVETANFIEVDNSYFFENHSKISEIQSLVEKYHNDLFEDKDYDKYRKK